ncbi:DNA-entry nuclease [Lacticaseibacillus kribbianus]|uniref:sunset domain-containing protein n=1 Tax=Lacticaseibacillus kribbianus TaxID=2926292 RepID=UPI001CD567AE|nr:DNA-entry nuclease [Lacticaseibacillus kribbianus]
MRQSTKRRGGLLAIAVAALMVTTGCANNAEAQKPAPVRITQAQRKAADKTAKAKVTLAAALDTKSAKLAKLSKERDALLAEQAKREAEAAKAESIRQAKADAEAAKKAAAEAKAKADAKAKAAAAAKAKAVAASQAKAQAAASSSRAAAAAAASRKAAAARSTGGARAQGKLDTGAAKRIIGNVNSKIYHVPGQAGYHMNPANAVYFATEAEAQAAGYRKAKR